MTIEDLFKALRDSVKYAVAVNGDKLTALQTFAVINSPEDVNSDTLLKSVRHKDTVYFHSKRWALLNYDPNSLSFDYPILTAERLSFEPRNLFNIKDESQCWVIQLNALYPDIEAVEASAKSLGKHIVREQIPSLMATLLYSTIQYLSEVVFASTDVDVTGSLYHPEELTELQNASKITTYSIDDRLTNRFRRAIKTLNENPSGGVIDWQGRDKLCGVQANLLFCLDACDLPDPNFEFNF